MAKRPAWCQECGVSFQSGKAQRSTIVPELCEECDRVVCAQCSSGCDRSEVDDDGVCYDCHDAERDTRERGEIMRRLEAWAVYEGTRRLVATHLAAKLSTSPECQQIRARHRDRWCFLWETSGDRQALQKIVEHLMPVWKREGTMVTEPPTSVPSSPRA